MSEKVILPARALLRSDRMLVIDATMGVSGDMLLAAMLGMLDPGRRTELEKRLKAVSESQGMSMALLEIDEGGEKGLALSYIHASPAQYDGSRAECLRRLASINAALCSEGSTSREILETIFRAEAEAHGIPADEVHLHELARPQALMNIAGIGLLREELSALGQDEYVATTITTGMGVVVIGHGAVRVPAPACKILLNGMKHQVGDAPGERATPTGIAAVKVLARGRQTEQLPATWTRKSVGFGTRRFAGRLGRTALLLTSEP